MIASKKSIAKAQNKKVKVKKPISLAFAPPKMYTSFNIFTQYGENRVVTSDKPMTLEEARFKYKALAISGND